MFYTELRLVPASIGDDESEGDYEEENPDDMAAEDRSTRWSRKSLYKASRGEIGLIWSIFRLLGTPTETTWPVSISGFGKLDIIASHRERSQEFRSLPGARMMTFAPTSPTELRTRLINLPSIEENGAAPLDAHPLDLIKKLMVLNPKRRLPAASAVKHAWFWNGIPLMLPPGHASLASSDGNSFQHSEDWKGCRLEDLIRPGVEQALARFRSTI